MELDSGEHIFNYVWLLGVAELCFQKKTPLGPTQKSWRIRYTISHITLNYKPNILKKVSADESLDLELDMDIKNVGDRFCCGHTNYSASSCLKIIRFGGSSARNHNGPFQNFFHYSDAVKICFIACLTYSPTSSGLLFLTNDKHCPD